MTVPPRATARGLALFMKEHAGWLEKALGRMNSASVIPRYTRAEYIKHKEEARALIRKNITLLNRHYQVPVGRVSIRDQKTCWGSCSGSGNLNFNYRLLFMPPQIAMYVVAHELCHLKEFNHSARFWALVSETVPDYKRIRQELHARGDMMRV